MICSHMPPLLLMVVSKNHLSSHGAEFLGLVLDFHLCLEGFHLDTISSEGCANLLQYA